VIKALRVFWLTFWLTCPACERGKMFRSLFTMNVRCPTCNIVFERDSGEVSGGMAINTVLMCFIGIAGAILAVVTDIPTIPLLVGMTVFMILFGVLFYRHARALWVGILYLTGSIHEDV
jgi:uncharacterized protein (DUF983 family)